MTLNDLKDNTALMIAGIVICGIAAYIFFDVAIEKILGLFGLGGAGAVALKAKSKKSKIIADAHMEMSEADSFKAVAEMMKADNLNKGTQDIADSIKPSNEKPKTGTKRKRFSAS
jgi:hypothetical protein